MDITTDRVSSELVSSVERLPTVPTSDLKPLIKKINKLLDAYINNELMFASFVETGAVGSDGVVSDVAIQVHKGRKDSISELVKVKMTLEGMAVERKDVVHTFDVGGLLEAIRGVRASRINREVV